MKPQIVIGILLLVGGANAQPPVPAGEVTSRTVEIKDGGLRFACSLFIDRSATLARPGVLLLMEDADGPAARARAVQLANAGYNVLTSDLMGPSALRLTRPTALKRLKLVFDEFEKQRNVAAHKFAAIGYGEYAAYALDYARAGEELTGVACVHGDLSPANRAPPKISGRVLAVVASDDPAGSLAKLGEFETEMKAANVDWDVIRYGGVGADFTDPKAKTYDADADARAHAALKQFLAELFPPPRARSFANGAPLPPKAAAPADVPDKALKVLRHVDEHDRAPDGFEGGRNFGNFEKKLPATDRSGRRIRYREWDVNPLKPSVNRGAERLVTGSDGSAHYTSDHYQTFKKIR